MEQIWIVEARKHIGLSEIPGKQHNPVILKWLKNLGAWWNEDETPWCGTFVAHCMRESKVPLPKHWYRAKGWLDWGLKLTTPLPGSVCVLEREGGGHVFFVLGRAANGDLVGIGGNQGNKVSIATFARSRVVGCRWPTGVHMTTEPLELWVTNGARSTNEG